MTKSEAQAIITHTRAILDDFGQVVAGSKDQAQLLSRIRQHAQAIHDMAVVELREHY